MIPALTNMSESERIRLCAELLVLFAPDLTIDRVSDWAGIRPQLLRVYVTSLPRRPSDRQMRMKLERLNQRIRRTLDEKTSVEGRLARLHEEREQLKRRLLAAEVTSCA